MKNQYAIVLLKPDAYKRNLRDKILEQIEKASLNLIYTRKILLTEEDIRGYQPDLNLPNSDGEVDWQYDIINAYTEEETEVFLFFGQNAISKINQLKKKIREKYINKKDVKNIIYNLLHTADDETDLRLNVEILIPEKIELLG